MKSLASASPSMSRTLLRQFLLFSGVGAIGTAGHYMTLIVLVHLAHIAPVYASTCGFVVGAIINYYLNYHYTFCSTKNHRETLVKFMLVAVLGAGFNGVIMWMGTEWLSFNYLLVQVLATGIVLLSNFTFNRIWTFAHTDKDESQV